jgi:hypothetical protein
MTRGEIKTAIKNQVDDSSVADAILNEWVQDADRAVQTWRPDKDDEQTFDHWDFLKETKNYETEVGSNAFTLPDNFRSFLEFTIEGDEKPYKVIDYVLRNRYSDHVCWIIGKTLYIKATPDTTGTAASLLFIRISDEFQTDSDEPEIESLYHGAHVAFGKSRYYNQQGDTELERENMAEFERVMRRKWRDQTQARVQANPETATIPREYLV